MNQSQILGNDAPRSSASLTHDETHVNPHGLKGIAAPSKGKSCLPSLVGVPSGNIGLGITTRDDVPVERLNTKGGNFVNSKKTPMASTSSRNTKPAKTKRDTPVARQQHNKKARSGDPNVVIERGVAEYRSTSWYEAAFKRGFNNQMALDRFNNIVRNRINDIDPNSIPVCMECGNSDLVLCEHFVTPVTTATALDQGVLVVPQTRGYNLTWRLNFVNGIKRMFVWPKFNSDLLVNHENRGFDPSIISDNEIWPEMYNYIRLHLNTCYKIDGKFDRRAKLAHCKKLSQRFLVDFKIPVVECLHQSVVNKINLTIARACDQRDDQTLYKERDPRWNFCLASVASKIPKYSGLMLAVVLILMIVAYISVNALQMIFSFSVSGAVPEDVVNWVYGRNQASHMEMSAFETETCANVRSIYSGPKVVAITQRGVMQLVFHYLKGTLQLLWRIVPTMSPTLSTNAI